jgi:periplasmic protein CpxP/Spy
MLKQGLAVLTVAGLLYSVNPASLAQDNTTTGQEASPAGSPPEHGHGRGHMDPAQHAAILAKRLKLSSDQQSKVEDIFKSEQSQMESLHSDASLSQQDRRSKMMGVHKSSDDQVRALLNPDQQKKWDEMQSRREERMSGHQGGDQGAGGTTPTTPPQ